MKGKSLASVFRGNMRWLIQCEYCGHTADGDSIEVAGANFFHHMFSGRDSSREHFDFAKGIRPSIRPRLRRAKSGGSL
jgi:hypothetical protein